jgi:transcriptional regulator with XRE-family HTH domain
MSPIDRDVGRSVRARREALAMSRDELAALLSIPTEVLRRQEEGALPITLAELHDLGRALGVGVGYLFHGALAVLEGAPSALRPCDLAPPGAERPDAAFLLSWLDVLRRIAEAEGLGHAACHLERAAEELRRCIGEPKG